jgi:hypothetical protein
MEECLVYEGQVNHLQECRDVFESQGLPHFFNSRGNLFKPLFEEKFYLVFFIVRLDGREVKNVEKVLNVSWIDIFAILISYSSDISFINSVLI